MFAQFNHMFDQIAEPESAARSLFVIILTLLFIWLLYTVLTHLLKKYVLGKAVKKDVARNFLLLWRYAWMGIALVFALISFSGSLTTLGISAAFFGMLIGWSLQAPVTGVAAWLMIILKRPFKIGDRIIIADIIGDVKDITLTHIVLNQVGGTIEGEERSGRDVMIPNAILFQQIIYNYTLDSQYILDEVPLVITYASDVGAAEKVLLRAARKATRQASESTDSEPYVRVEFFEHGVRLRLRYQAEARQRQKTSSDITREVIRGVNADKGIEFCYAQTVLHRPKRGGASRKPKPII